MMPTPPTGNREFQNEIVRIAELTVNTYILEGLTFQNCRIIGPAVVVFQESEISYCRWDAPDFNALFWDVPPSRQTIVGAVVCRRCVFSACSFDQIGIAGPTAMRAQFEDGLNAP